jgi:hypothetical protein
MNIFENYKATKLYVERLNELEKCPNPEMAKIFSNNIKKLFQTKVTSDKELESYKITEEDVQRVADEMWAEEA